MTVRGALVLRFAGVLALAGAVFCSLPARAAGDHARDDYRSAPLFFEHHYHNAHQVGDELDLLRSGYVRVERHDPVDATNFDWSRDSFNDYTWFMQMQDLRFLLPAIASSSGEDVRLALEWFLRWYAAYMVPEPATAHWGEPITAGYRAMVLSLLLKVEQARADPDTAVVGYLKSSIEAHQKFLLGTEAYDALSNHGFIAALGLYETTRVIANPDARTRALSRLRAMIDRTVSPAGVEKEQSVGYHFVVLAWLEEMRDYFGDLPGVPPDFVGLLSSTVDRMRAAGYYLQDHDGRLVQIGDTDSVVVDSIAPEYRIRDGAGRKRSMFDTASGCAVYKGDARSGDCRYVFFRIPDGKETLKAHAHDDALSVFFSYAGETILGDAGRYSYAESREREYVISARAHNTVMGDPTAGPGPMMRVARDAEPRALAGGVEWSASTGAGDDTWKRIVRVADGPEVLRVEDSLRPAAADNAAECTMVWNLGPDITDIRLLDEAEGKKYSWSLTSRKAQRFRIEVVADGPSQAGILDARLVRGAYGPMLGWYSPGDGILRPAPAIVLRLRSDPTVSVTTVIRVESGACGR